jgi:hypothetical protein
MKFLFRFSAKYRTDLSKEEVLKRIEELLKTKSRFLFFEAHRTFGTVSYDKFTLTRQRFDWWGTMSSRLQGTILNGNGTIVHTRITVPWLIVTIFSFITLTSLFAILKTDELTFNGEIRHADFSLKAMMVLLGVVFPSCMIFAVAILPAKFTEHKIIKILNLEELHDVANKAE